MRKLMLAVASCAVLVAFMGLSSTASAAPYSRCDGQSGQTPPHYNNNPVIREFAINTPKKGAFQPSGINGTGLACGQDPAVSISTLNDIVVLDLANGIEVATTGIGGTIPDGAYAGTARITTLYKPPIGGQSEQTDTATLIARTPGAGGTFGCPTTARACYEGNSGILGGNYSWVDANQTTLTIERVVPLFNIGNAGIAEIHSMSFCERAGAPGSNSCNPLGPVLQKNGAPSLGFGQAQQPGAPVANQAPCSNGNGIVGAHAVQRNGTYVGAPPAGSGVPLLRCVIWGAAPLG